MELSQQMISLSNGKSSKDSMVSKKKFYLADYELVKITWNDAQDHETGWTDLNKAKKHKLAAVVSIGWILSQTDKQIILVGDFIPEDGTTSRITIIPKDWCQTITTLVDGINES
jgi:hypothetical protein